MPDISVAAISIDAIGDRLHRIDLVWSHHQELPLRRNQNHVTADHPRKGAFRKNMIGKRIKMGDFRVCLIGELVDRQKWLLGPELKVLCSVIREVPCIGAIAHNEELDETEQGPRVSIPGIGLVLDDLLHRLLRSDAQRLQFDLDHRNPVHQEHHIVPVMTVVGVDPELMDDLERVLAPVLCVDKRVVQGCIVIAQKRLALA